MKKSKHLLISVSLSCLIFLVLGFFAYRESQERNDCNKAIALYKLNKRSDAIKLADQLLLKYPNSAKLYAVRGACNMDDNPSQAKEDFQKSIKLDEGYYNSYCGLAYIYEKEGQYKLAENYYKQSTDHAHSRARKRMAFDSVVSFYLRHKKYDEAISFLDESLWCSSTGETYYRLGELYRQQGKNKKAEEVWLKGIEAKFDKVEYRHKTYYSLANYYFNVQDYAKAKEYIKKCIRLSPNNDEYQTLYKNILSR